MTPNAKAAAEMTTTVPGQGPPGQPSALDDRRRRLGRRHRVREVQSQIAGVLDALLRVLLKAAPK